MEVDDVAAAAQWPADIREFVQTLAQAASCSDWPCAEARELVTAVDVQLQVGRTTLLDVSGLGPNAALQKLRLCLAIVCACNWWLVCCAVCQGHDTFR